MEELNRNLLQLFAEDGSEEAAEDGQETQDTGSPEAQEQQQEPEDLNAEFDALVKGDGKFREVYGKRVQKAVFDRMKGTKAATDRLQSFAPAFEVLAARYGISPDDPALAEKIAGDTGLLDEVAMRNGHSVETEMEIQRYKAQTIIQQILADQQMQQWRQEAEELKAKYPDFDLDAEAENPAFLDLMQNHHVTMEGAYLALNHDKVIQQTVRRAEKLAADTVAAGRNRPRENGMGSQAGAAMSKDPMKMTTEEFKKWEEAVSRGERVSFSQ